MCINLKKNAKAKKNFTISCNKIVKPTYQEYNQQIFIFSSKLQMEQKNFFSFQYINREEIKVSAVPHIEGLTVEDFIQYARDKPQLLKYLPEQRDWLHLDRQWVCDVLYTLERDGIQDKINKALKQRKEKLEHNRDLIVDIRPEFALALNSCLNFSHERGRSINLLKNSSKRKRLRSEIDDVKSEENELKENRQEFLQQVKRLKMEKHILEQQINELSQANHEFAEIYGLQNQQQEQLQFNI